jgi:hypothetical protein
MLFGFSMMVAHIGPTAVWIAVVAVGIVSLLFVNREPRGAGGP